MFLDTKGNCSVLAIQETNIKLLVVIQISAAGDILIRLCRSHLI